MSSVRVWSPAPRSLRALQTPAAPPAHCPGSKWQCSVIGYGASTQQRLQWAKGPDCEAGSSRDQPHRSVLCGAHSWKREQKNYHLNERMWNNDLIFISSCEWRWVTEKYCTCAFVTLPKQITRQQQQIMKHTIQLSVYNVCQLFLQECRSICQIVSRRLWQTRASARARRHPV